MQITRQADYAVRAVLYVSRLGPGGRAPVVQIARAQKLPVNFLHKIVAQLSAAGLVHTKRGRHGGVALTRPADEISLLEIVEAIDGPLRLSACTLDPSTCTMSDDCVVRVIWCQARAELARRLSLTKCGDLLGR